MGDPMISVEGVSFSYQRNRTPAPGAGPDSQIPTVVVDALKDITFTCDPGTITLICGASGSGKSTALRLVNGLIPHFNEGNLTGQVRVNGDDIPQAPLADLGMHSETVFQHPRTQFFTSEVMSELAFRGENWGLDPAVILDQIDRSVDEVGIRHLLDKRLDALSGGQLQQVACAQVLTPGTNVLVFDEPTSNLSPAAIDHFATLLQRLKAQGHTIVVAEHRVYFLNQLADQVLIMADGAITHRLTGEAFYALSDEDRIGLGLRTLVDPLAPIGSPRGAIDTDEALTLEQVTYAYRERAVLQIDQASFAKGKITALTGDNGVGKSTLARVICGLAKPAKGASIRLGGTEMSAGKRLASSTLVMQDVHRQLFGESVLAELLIGREHLSDHESELAILTELGLADTVDRHPLSLSGGQKQRLVIAAAVVADKQIYIFDEPTSGVDYRHLRGISQQMRHLADEGAVVIVITHDPELIATCADHIAVMEGLAGEGTGRQLRFYTNPNLVSPTTKEAADGRPN